jgi:hypothetical protein
MVEFLGAFIVVISSTTSRNTTLPTVKPTLSPKNGHWDCAKKIPAIFPFLEIVGNTNTTLRTYDIGIGTPNDEKFRSFVDRILSIKRYNKEIH